MDSTPEKAEYVYVTYINSTAEKVFSALTEPKFTEQYWSNHHNASDWKVGSRWQHQDASDASLVDCVGKVLENNRPTAANALQHGRSGLQAIVRDGQSHQPAVFHDVERHTRILR